MGNTPNFGNVNLLIKITISCRHPNFNARASPMTKRMIKLPWNLSRKLRTQPHRPHGSCLKPCGATIFFTSRTAHACKPYDSPWEPYGGYRYLLQNPGKPLRNIIIFILSNPVINRGLLLLSKHTETHTQREFPFDFPAKLSFETASKFLKTSHSPLPFDFSILLPITPNFDLTSRNPKNPKFSTSVSSSRKV